jgi:hypothetical protein
VITYRSLQNSKLCLREMRDALHRLPSLRWNRHSTTQFRREFQGDVAIVRMLLDIVEYMDCSVSGIGGAAPESMRNSSAVLSGAIHELVEELRVAAENSSIPRVSKIRAVTAASTRFYRAAKNSRLDGAGCRDSWMKAGLASSAAYQ